MKSIQGHPLDVVHAKAIETMKPPSTQPNKQHSAGQIIGSGFGSLLRLKANRSNRSLTLSTKTNKNHIQIQIQTQTQTQTQIQIQI